MFAHIHGINTPSMADVKLPMVEQVALKVPEYLTVILWGSTAQHSNLLLPPLCLLH